MEPAELLLLQIRRCGLAEPECEAKFAKALGKFWRFDFCWWERMLAVEFEGGSWSGGAHNRGKHFESDCMKYALAALLGWKVLRVNNHMVEDGRAIRLIEIGLRPGPPFPPDLTRLARERCEKCLTKAEKLKRLAKGTK